MVVFFARFAHPTLWLKLFRPCEDTGVFMKKDVAHAHHRTLGNGILDSGDVEAAFWYSAGQATRNKGHETKSLLNEPGL